MKLQAILLPALVGLPHAASLRATTDGAVAPGKVSVEAYLSIQGLPGKATEQDAETINAKLVEAFDDMTGTVGYYCPWWSPLCRTRCYFEMDYWQNCADEDPNYTWPGYHWDPNAWHWDCRRTNRCSYDDDNPTGWRDDPPVLGDEEDHSILFYGNLTVAIDTLPLIQAGAKKHIEHKMCAALRKSGVANLKYAKDCQFTLFEQPSVEGRCDAHGPIAADITIFKQGGDDLDDLEEAEVDLMKQTIQDVYNKAFLASGKGMNYFDIDGWFTNEDASKMVVRGEFEPLCPNDNNPTDKTVEPMDFQAALCDGFKNSGIPAFEHIRNCEFLQALGDVDGAANLAVTA